MGDDGDLIAFALDSFIAANNQVKEVIRNVIDNKEQVIDKDKIDDKETGKER